MATKIDLTTSNFISAFIGMIVGLVIGGIFGWLFNDIGFASGLNWTAIFLFLFGLGGFILGLVKPFVQFD